MTDEKALNIAILTIRLMKGFGVDTVVDQQATLLSKLGHRVTVFTVYHDAEYFKSGAYHVKIIVENMSNFLFFLKNARFDVVMAHTSPFFEILPFIRPYSFTVAYEHGSPEPSFFPGADGKARQCIKDYRCWSVYPDVHSVVAISNFVAEDIKWPWATVIYNGADHLKTDEVIRGFVDTESLAGNYNINPNKFKILCVSRFGDGEANYKGIDTFVKFKKLFKHDSRYEFIVLGRGTEEEKALIEKKGIKVIINATKEELISAYKLCDIFVSFSKWEGFNLPVVEASSYGKPAFAIDCCCHSEVTPLVFSDYRAMAKKINSLSKDDLSSYGRGCKDFVSRFTWKKNVSKLAEFFSTGIDTI